MTHLSIHEYFFFTPIIHWRVHLMLYFVCEKKKIWARITCYKRYWIIVLIENFKWFYNNLPKSIKKLIENCISTEENKSKWNGSRSDPKVSEIFLARLFQQTNQEATYVSVYVYGSVSRGRGKLPFRSFFLKK